MRGKDIALYAVVAAVVFAAAYYGYAVFLPQAYIFDEVYYAYAAYNILLGYGIRPAAYVPPPPNAENLTAMGDALNLEHPPLVKYIFALSILALGYKPVAWRLPGLAAYVAELWLAYMLGSTLVEDFAPNPLRRLAGAAAAALVALDIGYGSTQVLGLLDGYVALFLTAALYMAHRRRFVPAAVLTGLALAAKESALPAYLYMILLTGLYRGGKKAIVATAVVPPLVFAASYIPLLPLVGLHKLLVGVSATAINDVSPGHISATLVSTPWMWFIGQNPLIYYHVGDYALVALPPAWSLLASPLIALADRRLRRVLGLGFSMWLGFLAVYLAGNRTMFSTYVADFSPLFDIALGVFLATAIYIAAERGTWSGQRT